MRALKQHGKQNPSSKPSQNPHFLSLRIMDMPLNSHNIQLLSLEHTVPIAFRMPEVSTV